MNRVLWVENGDKGLSKINEKGIERKGFNSS